MTSYEYAGSRTRNLVQPVYSRGKMMNGACASAAGGASKDYMSSNGTSIFQCE